MIRAAFFLLVTAATGFSANWSPQLAAQYLDSRQAEWFAWKPAASADGPCVSCHTGLTYLLARPALRHALGESKPTSYETGLLDRLRSKVGAKPPANLQSVEVIFAALFLAREDAGKPAFDQLWSLQLKDGGWKWYQANLEPWETPSSNYYGAALGAIAIGSAPADYRNQPEVRDRVKELTAYLRSCEQTQPLHSRLAILWASSALPGLLDRQPLIDEILKKQEPDGGWTIESLGPWTPHPDAPPSAGSNSYATGYVAYVLQKAGIGHAHPAMVRALDWLKAHQNQTTGAWPADSLNKVRPADSMEGRFMQDAATAFAAMALLEARD